MTTREFQFNEGTSNKFWRITLDGSKHVVQFGRVGTAGQSQTKEFASEDESKKAADKLIQEKVKKGYVEVAADESAVPSAAPAPKPVPVASLEPPPPEKAPPQPAPTACGSEAAVVVRKLTLSPEHLNRAPWRGYTVLPKPEPEPFTVEDGFERLRLIGKPSEYRYSWDWEKARISPAMTPEEARFWLAAMTAPINNPIQLTNFISAFRTVPIPDRLTMEDIKVIVSKPDISEPFLILPMYNLVPIEELVDFLLETAVSGKRSYQSPLYALMPAFQKHVFPWLTESERASLRERLGPTLNLQDWPTDFYEVPPSKYHLAAALGMHDELLPLVESWKDGLYSGDGYGWHVDHYHHPQDILFGLRDPQAVIRHMRRLKLKLRDSNQIKAWLAHTEFSALDFVGECILAVTKKEDAADLLSTFAEAVVAPEAAPAMLELSLASKAPRIARVWLESHPVEAAAGLIPLVGGRGKTTDAAVEFLRFLKRHGFNPTMETLAESLSDDLRQKLRTLVLDYEEKVYPPLDEETTPDWLRDALAQNAALLKAKQPGWVTTPDLPPILHGDLRWNEDQAHALLVALQKSKLEAPHPFVAEVRKQGGRRAFDAFVWKLFEKWLADGAPAKEGWALAAAGLLGDDQSALKLAALVRVWPGEAQHKRAVAGLEALRRIGSDTALMQISGIAQKVAFKALKERAGQCLNEIAEERGLSRAELEDRIVPDCGLDERGSRTFDFGPRRFTFVLGPDMKPMIRDESGKPKPDLPKPNAKDDPRLAQAAVEEWKLLKKQVAEVAKLQPFRLEQAMVTGRSWTPAEFDMLLVKHPLMTNLTRMLVWGGYDEEGKPLLTFRVTEDQTLADQNDEPVSLEGVARVRVVHPLNLAEDVKGKWGELFGDYEIVSPFEQLGRPVYGLNPDERDAKSITRFAKVKLPPQTLVFTLEKMGWTRGVPQDAGVFYEHSKAFLNANVTAFVHYQGVPVGYMEGWDDQTMESCMFVPGIRKPTWYDDHTKEAIPLGSIDPVALSEVLRDLTLIGSKGK